MRLDRRTLLQAAAGVAAALALPRAVGATGGIIESDADAAQLGATPPPVTTRPLPGDTIRVLLLRGRPAVRITAAGGFAVFDGPSGGENPILRAQPGQSRSIDATALAHGSGGAVVEPVGDAPLQLDGRSYRGRLLLFPDGGGMMAVNQLPIELYVLGVLGREVSPKWPAAVLQAHAIVSRSYALGRRKDAAHAFDVSATTADQVYGGVAAESAAGNDAVYQTRGQLLWYGGGVASAFFSSCCGGHTESAGALWGRDIPYLGGVADPYCAGSPHYRWRSYVSEETLRARLSSEVAALGEIAALEPLDVDNSGRARQVAVQGQDGRREIEAKAFRERLGSNVVRSTLLHRMQIANSPEQLQPDPAFDDPSPVAPPPPPQGGPLAMIEGAGWGHGVGLCQWGARGMALRGASATQILAFYFPGTAVVAR
ncbi:SpoIID/LytB domain-containing protein [bacterium]|nr:MAG: SpoIID/LytB domain-containing protein [bacterium]